LQPTAASHDRVMILEVMGRDSGQIALAAGIAGGADVILVPEIPYDIDIVAGHITRLRRGAHNFAIVVVSEAVRDKSGAHVQRQHALGGTTYGGISHVVGDALARLTGAETRVTILGHVQRGGQPTWDDRLVASAFGVHAVDLVAEGNFDRMVAWQNRRVVDVPLKAAFEHTQLIASDDTLVRTARGLGICLGDE
jgi:ATP-dependent phosphofructokinase / diphosphate-dependent phosphofructokinase